MEDYFTNVRQLVPQLLQFKTDFPDKKIAFCFSGGGARGAYFGGVIEAIQQEINKQPQQSILNPEDRWKPDIICGSSAGALAGFSYWMDGLLPSNQSPYACRQSKIWKFISDGNKGAEKLFSNSALIDVLSKSSVELDALMDEIEKLNAIEDIKKAIIRIDEVWTNTKLVISNTASFDINRLKGDLKERVENIKNKTNNLGSKPSKLKELKDYVDNLISLIGEIRNFVPGIAIDIANIDIQRIKALFTSIKDLHSSIQNGKDDIKEAIVDIIKLFDELKDFFNLLTSIFKNSLKSIKENSSLMNTNGLQNIIENYIYESFPAGTFTLNNGKIEARQLDQKLIDLINQKRASGKKVPELFVTGTNINANRVVAFSLATEETNNNVANRNLWVVQLDDLKTDFNSHKTSIVSNEFVFGGKRFETDYTHQASIATTSISNPVNPTTNQPFVVKDLNAVFTAVPLKKTMIKTSNFGVAATPKTVSKMSTSSKKIKFTIPELDFSNGKSLVVGAVLTSASIPIAFPPRQWTFYSKSNVSFKHWMVDGGIVDNRPIDVAVKAGADFIISFELTPLLSATRELKKECVEYPSFMEVISKSMMDAPLNAGFYRYFEDLVSENAANANPQGETPKKLFRMAPMMYNSPKDADYGTGPNWDEQTPGTLDFNGRYDDNRNLKMGLFDWFMKGYIDAKGGDDIDNNDPVNKAYMELPSSYGAIKNAYIGRRSGFYDASKKAHPDTNPAW